MSQNEYHIHIAFIQWLVCQYPKILFTISPSGMRLPIGLAVKFKRMGYRSGTPDVLIFEPAGGFHGLFIEIKDIGGRPSDNQKEFIHELTKRGYKAVIAYGFDEAVRVADSYLKFSQWN